MALGSTQPLKEMSIRNTSCGGGRVGGQGSRHTGQPSLPASCANCLEITD